MNPPSYFLRFLNRPSGIIAPSASIGGDVRVDGSVDSSFRRTAAGIPRASAVLILNDDTGYPFAVRESSIISATRTAASAALADWLQPGGAARPGSGSSAPG